MTINRDLADLAQSLAGGIDIADGGTGATTASAARAALGVVGKNLIQNGSFAVAQRGTSFAAQGTNNALYTLDRWANYWHQGTETGEFTVSQDTDVPTAHKGYSMKLDCTTAEASVSADEAEYGATQPIEAQNLQQLAYGTASAKSITLSFWVKSPKSGTHCVSFYQADGARTYIAEYTVASANTWESISITVPGDTSGTINNDNGEGLRVSFPMFAGANRVTTAGSWTAGSYYASSNQQNLLDNTANNFYLFNVQLEVGSVATDFEHEDYGTTLAKCQRYFERISGRDNYQLAAVGVAISATQGEFVPPWLVEKRASPTISYSGNIYLRGDSGGTTYNATNVVAAFSTRDHASLTVVVASGLTIGRCYLVETGNTTSDYFQVDAEL